MRWSRKADSEISQIVLEVTYQCPLRCGFCYNGWHAGGYPAGPELTAAEYADILGQLPRPGTIVLSGGEPLLRSDIIELVRIAKGRASRVTVLTSGILLTQPLAESLADAGAYVQIPFHGGEAYHDRVVGRVGAFRKAMTGVEHARKAGLDFGGSCVVSKGNIDGLRRTLEVQVALGARSLLVIRFVPGGRGLGMKGEMLTPADVKRMLDDMEWVSATYGVPVALGVPNLPCVASEEGYKHIGFHRCGAGIDWFTVDPSGRMRACNHSPKILGDLRTQRFEDVWRGSPALKQYRDVACLPAVCSGCADAERCMGGCRAGAETYHGSPSAPDPLLDLAPPNG